MKNEGEEQDHKKKLVVSHIKINMLVSDHHRFIVYRQSVQYNKKP